MEFTQITFVRSQKKKIKIKLRKAQKISILHKKKKCQKQFTPCSKSRKKKKMLAIS